MTTAAPSSRFRLLAFAALLLIGVAIGYQSISMGMGQAAVRAKNGPAAASLRPQNGWGLALLAERQLQLGQASEAIATSREAIRHTPLAVIAVRTMARAEDKLHGPGAGERAWQAASLLGWRDKQVQVWAAFRALSNRQADIFAMRADALMRTGDPDEVMTRFIRQAVLLPDIRKAFIARLATNPPWRVRFFQAEVPPKGRALDGVVAVLGDLGAGQTPPTRQELRDAIMGLINVRRYREAVTLDRRFISRTPDPESLLDDGGFELRQSDYQRHATPFDWALDARSAAIEEAEGRRYAVVYAGVSPEPALGRYLALSPGAYRLGFAMTGPADSSETLQFAAKCAPTKAVVGMNSSVPLPEEGRNDLSFDFTVPANCGLVELSVQRVKPGSSDALIDDVRLQRI